MKTILITGSTAGIGILAAAKLANDGHHIIVHGRNTEKVTQAVQEIKSESTNENITGYVSDLSDLSSIELMKTEILESISHIDVLINNAGVFKSPNSFNEAGLDLRFAVNYFAPYLLTLGLLPLLEKSEAPRVINLSSAAQSSVSLGALRGDEAIDNSQSYAQSKLALTMWSFAFAKDHPDITTIAVNPGSLLNTRMANEAYGQHWSPASKGSDIIYELALSKDHIKSSGLYFNNDLGNPKGAFSDAHEDAYNSEKIATLLAETEHILNNY